jgi:hypothetical protein
VRSEIVAKVQPVLSAALAGLEAGKTQILFEKVIECMLFFYDLCQLLGLVCSP